ncbi:MAG: carbon starvation protein A [Paludibacteraceae bacterium]|nr:carbon starvation protein A [Paludibacteraceae bacterium]
MISFSLAVILLVIGYIVYGRLVERIFRIDKKRVTPAILKADGVDFISMPAWKIFLIQFLNIAGLGPIFGAIMGIMFGPAAFIWIVFGCVFGGAVHDYFSGMLSLRSDGASCPELIGEQLGDGMRNFVRFFACLLLICVGVVFVSGPADILHQIVPSVTRFWWIYLVFAYYILATILPIDKLIGRIYPLFGALLLFMAVGILVAMYATSAPIPEVWQGISRPHPDGLPLFPMMFISIACGAVSGFHATQSPMMARCMTNEKYGRPCFYGAMIVEGVVALIWAAAASSFWGSIDGLHQFIADCPKGSNTSALAVNEICNGWLGTVGGILAVLGVVVAPITSGDTALRSARLIVADSFHFDQSKIIPRLAISIPIFAIVYLLLNVDFSIIWRYNAWFNQTLATITLWTISVYLARRGRKYWIALLPAAFMTFNCVSYLFIAPECFICLEFTLAYIISAAISVALMLWLVIMSPRLRKTKPQR